MLSHWLLWIQGLLTVLTPGTSVLNNLRTFLEWAYAPVLTSLLTLTAAALLLARRPLHARLSLVPVDAWIVLLVIVNGALALRLFLSPHMPQVYFDEISFLNTSQNLAQSGVNQLSSIDYAPGELFHACPAGWQFLISLAYRIVGVRPPVAFLLATLVSTASVPFMFLFLFEMAGPDAASDASPASPAPAFPRASADPRALQRAVRVGLWGALFLAVLPVHLRLAGCTALETSSLFFLLALLYALTVWGRTGDRSMLLLAACVFAWFANTRMENSFALGPLVGVYAFLLRPNSSGRRDVRAGALALGVAALFSVPALLADYYGVVTHFYFFYQSPAATHAQILQNVHGNLRYWVENRIHPLFLTLLALVGAVGEARRRTTRFWIAWTVLLVAFYTANPSCDFALHHTLDSWRNALQPALGVLVCAALGADYLVTRACGSRLLAAGLVVVTCLVPLSFRSFVTYRTVWMRQWEALCSMRADLPRNSLLLVCDSGTTVRPGNPPFVYLLAMTTGHIPYLFPPLRNDGRTPQIVSNVASWVLEKKSLFLYHLSTGTVQNERDMAMLRRFFRLRPVAGSSSTRDHWTCSLWKVEGAASPASHARNVRAR